MGKHSKFIYAVATLTGSIIGVGIFSLPYITLRVGVLVMLGYLFVLTILVILIHYLFGEVALATPDFLRLPGFANLYLGKTGKQVALFSSIFGGLGSILAYIIIGGEFLEKILSPFFGGGALLYSFIYFIIGATFVFWGIKAVSRFDFWAMILFFVSLVLIIFKSMPFFKMENLSLKTGDWADVFLPYGPIFFALSALTMIPEIEEMLGENKKLLRKVIFISILIPAVTYLLFMLLVLGVSGLNTSSAAIPGLKNYLSGGILNIAFLAGIITTFTSFLGVALTLKKTLWYDLRIPKALAWGIACFIPFILFLLGLKDFVKVIGLVGGALMAIDGIIILLMYKKIKKSKTAKILTYSLSLIFVLGLIYEIIYFVKQ
jgi:amino acid permease